jgi:hypothetical protein
MSKELGPGVGFEFPSFEVKWLKRDLLLFSNSIGATYPDELHFLYVRSTSNASSQPSLLTTSSQELHPSFAAFPTYPIILPFKHTDVDVIDFYARSNSEPIAGVPKFDTRHVLDGERSITFYKPLPVSSEGRKFEIRSKVLGVYDKGKATVVETEQRLVDKESGECHSRATGKGFYVGQGGWGGPKGSVYLEVLI